MANPSESWLKVSLIFLLAQVIHSSNGDVESRIDTLQAELVNLRDELADVSKIVDELEKTVKLNIADQKVDKAIGYILLNKQEKASIYWTEVVKYSEPSLLGQYLNTLVEGTYIGSSTNFYYVLDFLQRNQLYMGYPMLLQELENHHELHSGQEIFALAYQIKMNCGINNELYNNRIPKAVKDILAGPVILKNVDNMGYIMAGEHLTECTSRQTCYGSPRSQVFVYRLRTTMEEMQTEKRALWQFMAPEDISDLPKGFYLMNQEHGPYFVFKQRPTASLLRDNITFDSYFAKDMHAQFLPSLVPDASPEEHLLRIGIRENFFGKVEYFFSDDFKKNNKLDFSRRPMFDNDMKGYVWEVIPVHQENDDNAIESGRRHDEKCDFRV